MSFLKKKSFALCAGIGVGCALALTALLALPFALAIRAEALPQGLGWIFASVCAAAGTLIPTAVIGRARGRQTMAVGGALGGGYVILAALGCALGGDKCAFGPWLGALTAAVAAGALLGALLAVRQNTHRRRRH